MGNRALITSVNKDLAVYLHWNGGRDSVERFCEYCSLRGFRPPSRDNYGYARLAQVAANYLGAEGLSVGVQDYMPGDGEDMDNGTYVLDGWRIAGRLDLPDGFREQRPGRMTPTLMTIDQAQPEAQQLGADFIEHGEWVDAEALQVGDEVFVPGWHLAGRRPFVRRTVVKVVVSEGGDTVTPYVNVYRHEDGAGRLDWEWNQNNRLRGAVRRYVEPDPFAGI